MRTRFRLAAVAAALATTVPAHAAAPTFDISFEAAGVQNTTATFSSGGVETFDTRPSLAGFTTDFGTGGTISGRYSGAYWTNDADMYGGAGGAGKYAATYYSGVYSLDLSSAVHGGVNYFGLWLSAIDPGSQLAFYSRGKRLFTFNPNDVMDAVTRSAGAAGYLGNPNASQLHADSGETFVFANFFSTARSFDKVVFTGTLPGAGFESDNHTVGHFLTRGNGTSVAVSSGSFPTAAVPEPTTWALLLSGFGLVGSAARRRRPGVVVV